MEIINEIFEIFGLLFSMAAHKTAEAINKIKQKGAQYLRILKWLIAIAALVPLILGVLGVILKAHWLIGLGGIVLAVVTLIFVLMTGPMISLIETIFRFFRKSESQNSETLARRFVNGVNTLLIAELIATLYFVLIPWETNPRVIVPLVIAMLILGILAMRNLSTIAGLIRFIAFVIAFGVLVISTVSFIFPKTMGEMQKSIPSIDEKMQKDIKSGVSSMLQDKPKPPPDTLRVTEKKTAQVPKPVQDSSLKKTLATPPKKQEPKTSGSRSMKRPRGIFAFLSDDHSWKDFTVPANIADAVPTNIKVQRGDSIDFDVTGNISVSFVDRYNSNKEGSVGPEGVWPTWMTQTIYRAQFIEFASNTCWNPVFRIGSDPNAEYFATHTNSTHIANTDGLIWLRINDDPKSNAMSGMTDRFEGEFDFALRIRPASQAFRDSLVKKYQDSLATAEKRLRDSLLIADRAFQNMVHHDSARGWTTIRFSLSVPEAFPTNIVVDRGDSIEIITQGSATLFLRNRERWDSPWSSWEPHIVSPVGIWPLWMTADRYGQHFKETVSRKCWNLCLRIGPDAKGQLHDIGQQTKYHIITPGDIWLKVNRYVGDNTFGDSLSGEFIVKIKVYKFTPDLQGALNDEQLPVESSRIVLDQRR